jgi:hypothetical protein
MDTHALRRPLTIALGSSFALILAGCSSSSTTPASNDSGSESGKSPGNEAGGNVRHDSGVQTGHDAGGHTGLDSGLDALRDVASNDVNPLHDGMSGDTIPPSTVMPDGPTGTYTLVWHDEFDDSQGSSGPTHGLNAAKWNSGFYSGPSAPGQPGDITAINAEGNTNNYHGPGVLKFPGDGSIHFEGVSPGPDNGGSYEGRTFEVGGLNTSGLMFFNPANVALGSTLQAAVHAGTVTAVNGPSVFEVRMRLAGPATAANISQNWPVIWITNSGNFSGGADYPGGTGYQAEIDFIEWFTGQGPDGQYGKFDLQVFISAEQHKQAPSVPTSLYNTDMSLAFHTYTYALSESAVSVYCDGQFVFTENSSDVPMEWQWGQYLMIEGQSQKSGANPPNTTAAGNTDMMVDYARVWTAM